MQQKKGSKRIEMIIKMVNEFKLTVVHFARPNPMQICACAWIYRWTKKLWKIRTGPPCRRAARPLGLRAAELSRAVGRVPLGLWASGPSRAVGRGPVFRKTPGFERRNSMLVMCPLPRSDWSSHEGNLLQPIRSTTRQI